MHRTLLELAVRQFGRAQRAGWTTFGSGFDMQVDR